MSVESSWREKEYERAMILKLALRGELPVTSRGSPDDLFQRPLGRCYSAGLMGRAVLRGRAVDFSKRARLGILAALLVLLLGHIVFWYWPRSRAVDPSTSALASSALSSESYPLGLWVPYPHQNLGVLAKGWGELPALAADIALLADAGAPRWMGFGPFAVPPARELAVMVDPEGGQAVAVARVYPVLAFVARAAGALARNPWLGGGVIESNESRIEVRWKGTCWHAVASPVDAPEAPLPEIPASSEASRPAGGGELLASLRLNDRWDLLPEGVYGLRQERGTLVFGSTPGEAGALEEASDPLASLESLMVGAVSLVALGQSTSARGLVLYSGTDSSTGSSTGDEGDGMPGKAGFSLLNAQPTRQLPLAGLGVAALLGSEGHSGRASGWYVLASSEQNFLRSAFIVPDLARLTRSWASNPEPAPATVRWAAVARPDGVLEVLDGVAEALQALGPGMEAEYRCTAALGRLLRPLEPCPRATLMLGPKAGETELRVECVD